jgi:hypothetical protein
VLSLEGCPLSPAWIGTGTKAGTGGIEGRTVIEIGATEIGTETGTVAVAGMTVTATTRRVAKETALATWLSGATVFVRTSTP